MTIKTVHLSPYVSVQGEKSEVAKYGRRNVPKMIRQVDKLRHIIASEGSPAIQEAWGDVEEHIDYAYRADFSKVPTVVFETQNPSLLTKKRAARRFAYLVIGLVLAVILAAWTYAMPAGATPWTDENGNPNPDCTGSCHETGIPNPPEPPAPSAPQQSREGNRTGKLVCGCDASGQEWFVILRDGVMTAADRRACERLAVNVRECR